MLYPGDGCHGSIAHPRNIGWEAEIHPNETPVQHRLPFILTFTLEKFSIANLHKMTRFCELLKEEIEEQEDTLADIRR